jgi:peptidoglycan hydrolase-like protein with peptidoglycan-binding domain
MKNLFIINEEEKKRILNLHESATKRYYLSEELPFTGNQGYYQKNDKNVASKKDEKDEKDKKGEEGTVLDKTVIKQKTQPNPMVAQIQNKLMELGYSIGSTKADGILGPNTLKGVLTALGTSENLKTGEMVPKQITSVTDQSSQVNPATPEKEVSVATAEKTKVADTGTNTEEEPFDSKTGY